MKVKNQIRYIKLTDIAPHPDNPRQDLGDLTELADSIRAKGILENLVVIRNPDNLKRIAFAGGGSAEVWGDDEPTYRVVVGHRRLAAAKLAGLDMVPCVLQKMTRDEAIAAMLTENGQRADLTPYEEARGFRQLSLDMGKSVKQIQDMTGFGETTIRSRLKLAELDGEKVQAGLERGATLYDFAELDKIKNPRLRAEVLEKAGTPNFRNELKTAQQKERRQEILDRWAAAADAFAKRIENPDYAKMEFVRSYGAFNKQQTVERPADAGETTYYYTATYPYLSIFREKAAESDEARAAREAKAAAEAARKARIDALGELTERHFSLRKDFVSGRGVKRAAYPLIMRYAAAVLIGRYRVGYEEFNLSLLSELLGLEVDTENSTWEEVRAAALQASEARLLLCTAYVREDKRNNGYYKLEWNQDTGVTEVQYKENPGLDSLYELLTALGYRMSDEEKRMRDGTHVLFGEAEQK